MADQRFSGTRRNRKLSRLRLEVECKMRECLECFFVSWDKQLLKDWAALARVHAELQTIRDDFSAEAPATWEELLPVGMDDLLLEEGKAHIRERAEAAKAARVVADVETTERVARAEAFRATVFKAHKIDNQ